jgi:predicted nucleic acid-binding protein
VNREREVPLPSGYRRNKKATTIKKFSDQNFSLCDSICFAQMEQYDISVELGIDKRFYEMGKQSNARAKEKIKRN